MSSQEDFCAQLNQRLDNLEELLRISVVQRVIEDVGDNRVGDIAGLLARSQGRALLRGLKKLWRLSCTCTFSFGNATCLLLTSKESLNIRLIRNVNAWLKENHPDYTPVYFFQTLNGTLKKRLREENISFCLAGRELHVALKK